MYDKYVCMCIYIYIYTHTHTHNHVWQQLHKNAASTFEQVLEVTPYKATNFPSGKLAKLDEPHMHDIAGEAGTSS